MKRFLSIAVASAMVAAALTGCGSNPAGGTDAPTEGAENSAAENDGAAAESGEAGSAAAESGEAGSAFRIDRKSVV